jgi:hypothetical protein
MAGMMLVVEMLTGENVAAVVAQKDRVAVQCMSAVNK